MLAPVRPIRGRWPVALERLTPLRRFFRLDPLIVLDEGAGSAAFREAMSSIYVGGTIKITGSNRHPETDQLLIDTVDLSDATIVDIGASDGSTSLELIERLPSFRSYTIADLYLRLRAVDVGRRTLLFSDDDTCVLVVGRRAMAWPAESRAVHTMYRRSVRAATARLPHAREALLLNPAVRRRIKIDERVRYLVHDIFTPLVGQPDVIKVANLLRRLYFDDADIVRALQALRDSLPVGGHLMIVDNPRGGDPTPRAGIWRRSGDGFVEAARLGEPEIAELVAQVG